MQNRSIKIPASNRQILNLAFGGRYNIRLSFSNMQTAKIIILSYVKPELFH